MKNQNSNKIKTKFLKFEELSWKQIENLDKNKTIVFLPISPLEEHGPHLPVGTDLIITKDAVIEAIKLLNKERPDLFYITLPIIPIGFCKFCSDFPGSISSSSKSVRDIIYNYGSSLAKHGFKYLIICTYHMSIFHLKGIYQAMSKLEKKFDLRIYEPWGPYFHSNEIEKNEPKLGFDTSKEVHGCFRETSLMKYQYPYLVDESYKDLQNIYIDLSSPRYIGKTFKQIGIKDGYIGSPAKADADYGRWFFYETVKIYAKSAIDLYEENELRDLPPKIKSIMKAFFWH